MASRLLRAVSSMATTSQPLPNSRTSGGRGFASQSPICRFPRGAPGPGGGAPGSGGPYRPYRSSSNTVLLDKFVKKVKGEASFIVKAPFNLKVKGSYFDPKDNSVDREKNKRIAEGRLKPESDEAEVTFEDQAAKAKREVEKEALLSELPGIMEKLMASKSITDDELETFAEMSDDVREDLEREFNSILANEEEGGAATPIHILLYGRRIHRVDSYSVVDVGKKFDQSHVYLTDAVSVEEAQAMFGGRSPGSSEAGLEASGSISIWQPRTDARNAAEESEYRNAGIAADSEMVSGAKIYVPNHMLEQSENGIKGVFLVPTIMERIYIQSKHQGTIELDGSLIRELTTVGLYTDYGAIKVRDLAACEVRLASRYGDITCDGTLEGHVTAETYGEGDFTARHVDGAAITVTTDAGDVAILGECNSMRSQFFTRLGDVILPSLWNSCVVLIREEGSFRGHINDGDVQIVNKKGYIFATVDSIASDSSLQIGDGEVRVKVPYSRNFRIRARGPQVSVSPKIQNTGDIFASEIEGSGMFEFVEADVGYANSENFGEAKGQPPVAKPVLNILADRGLVKVELIEDMMEFDGVEGGGNGSNRTS